MSKLKPMPCLKEEFLSLVKAFLEWSMTCGIKITIVMSPTEVKKVKNDDEQRKFKKIDFYCVNYKE